MIETKGDWVDQVLTQAQQTREQLWTTFYSQSREAIEHAAHNQEFTCKLEVDLPRTEGLRRDMVKRWPHQEHISCSSYSYRYVSPTKIRGIYTFSWNTTGSSSEPWVSQVLAQAQKTGEELWEPHYMKARQAIERAMASGQFSCVLYVITSDIADYWPHQDRILCTSRDDAHVKFTWSP